MTSPKRFLARNKIITALVVVVLASLVTGLIVEDQIKQWYGENGQYFEERGGVFWWGKTDPRIKGDRDVVPTRELGYLVTEVIDGDTVKVISDGRTENVRLLGIDAPELNDRNSQSACFGRLAKQRLMEKVEGKKAMLSADNKQGDRDRYGRWLRDIRLVGDGEWINGWLVMEGLAAYYKQYPVNNSEKLIEYEMEAKKQYKGLWSGRCE